MVQGEQLARVSERDREVAVEQAHVDVVSARVEELRREATVVRDEQLTTIDKDHAGAVYERDVMVNSDRRTAAGARAAVRRAGLRPARHGRGGAAAGRAASASVRRTATCSSSTGGRRPPRPFYSATERRPEGVARRRVITSRGNRVLDVDDEVLDADAADRLGLPTIGGGALMAALRRSRDDHMHDIVATIQREQDEAIRYPATGVVLIDGGPGTGKTVVALHRAAYLLHANRERYRSSGVLVVGPDGGVQPLHRAGAALPGRDDGGAAVRRRAGRRHHRCPLRRRGCRGQGLRPHGRRSARRPGGRPAAAAAAVLLPGPDARR